MRSKSCLFYPAWQFIYVKLVCAWRIFRCIFNFVLPRLLLKCGYLFLQNNAKNLSIYLPIYLYLLYTYLYISISIYIYILHFRMYLTFQRILEMVLYTLGQSFTLTFGRSTLVEQCSLKPLLSVCLSVFPSVVSQD